MPVAVITGAGRGIGRALVDAFISRGYKVAAIVRAGEDVPVLAELGKDVFPYKCDITRPHAEQRLADFLGSNFGQVDVLVNNAGFGATAYGIEKLKLDELDATLSVHLYGPIRCVRAALPLLRAAESPVVINVSSRFGSLEWVASGTVPADQATYAYRIAKGAMNMLTSCLAAEFADTKIRVLSVDPGKVKTRFGPKDADVEPEVTAERIADLVASTTHTATFVHAISGERIPW
jgi:NAD(P)-dependent dehydrogenase (short-subunit alcohol dehydrogenase family)